ncbi:S-adenosyl-L-methionine-dependent methyltransferase [Lasiosphaeris hirsuta]|uniref:S-adenosyl-L-methionine-dependent methyltransferase n=1 Tax=Lasiosphaeris hirsuta TaxID=260670 RepID=A0AA39ZV65_9PEZI|nr:S-adenosyl-L-methionine-dependent methyltransferase [Lasiosphaeris hirsuta]
MAQTTPLENPAPLEVDDNADAGSLLDDGMSSTASITSSIIQYRRENGRTYHAYKDGKYVMPNDEQEQDRLDLQHNLFLLTFNNSLYLSPAGRDGQPPLRHVLDVGTGTGIWATDFADEFPEAQVTGVDLSPIQPGFTPPNVTFEIADVEDAWTFGVKFDFIYSRMMTASLADWPAFFKTSFENLAPGGWIELADIAPITSDDGTLTEDSATFQWVSTLLGGTKLINRPFDGAVKYKAQLGAQGFENVCHVLYKWPQNTWPKDAKYKELGAMTLENITSGLHGLSAGVYLRILGWSPEDLDVLLEKVKMELKDTKIHSYWPIYVTYGQKPKE